MMVTAVLYIIFVLTYSNGGVTCASQTVKPRAAVTRSQGFTKLRGRGVVWMD